MKPVRSLPPELQALLDKYNELLSAYGYDQPFYSHGELTEMQDFTLPISRGGIFKETGLTPDELRARNAEIVGVGAEILEVAKSLKDQGKITFSEKDIPNLSRIANDFSANDTFLYALPTYREDGTRPNITFYAPDLANFYATSNASPVSEVKPMRPVKLEQQAPDMELKESPSISVPELEKELMMRVNPRMRTGQEPSYYIIKEGNRRVVRPVEEEELQYYRSKNRI